MDHIGFVHILTLKPLSLIRCREHVQPLFGTGQEHDSYGCPRPRRHCSLVGAGCDGRKQLWRDALEQLESRGEASTNLSDNYILV
jgi:hypothetical protein